MKEDSRSIQQRIFWLLLIIAAVLAAWNIRLFWVQVAASRSWTSREIDLVESSVLQRGQSIVADSGRGDFYDALGRPLTGETIAALAVFPAEDAGTEGEADRRRQARAVSAILGIAEERWLAFEAGLHGPGLWSEDGRPVALTPDQAQRIDALGSNRLRVIDYRLRYGDMQAASQVIGYIGQNPERIARQFADRFRQGELRLTSQIGNAGLEKTFERWLAGIGPTTATLYTDGMKRTLPGLGLRASGPANPNYPVKVMTTLDADIQRQIEQAMDRLHISSGAVVVLDAQTADTIAMASRPAFHPQHVHLEAGAWSNRALKEAVPGSIFKTVTAAAALEERAVKPDDTFECSGELGRYGFTCWKKGGHGVITFAEGFAQSCNIAFAEAARRVGGDKLEQYARKLGLAAQVGWVGDVPGEAGFRQWDAEDSGQVYGSGTNPADDGVLVQTSIGQRDVRVTPLQAANLVATLLRGGEAAAPRIVKEIRFRDDRLLHSFPPAEPQRAPDGIRRATARLLLEWMEAVVDHGTGKELQSAVWHTAGKSGTAQVKLKNGAPGVNEWFIGYGPTEHPKYAVSVVVTDRPENASGHLAVKLFREVMDVLARAQ